MKCSHCHKEIENELNMVVEAPDGDCYHAECHGEHVKQRTEFFNNIHDDEWYKRNYPELNQKQ